MTAAGLDETGSLSPWWAPTGFTLPAPCSRCFQACFGGHWGIAVVALVTGVKGTSLIREGALEP